MENSIDPDQPLCCLSRFLEPSYTFVKQLCKAVNTFKSKSPIIKNDSISLLVLCYSLFVLFDNSVCLFFFHAILNIIM